jgi:hypothetical protein
MLIRCGTDVAIAMLVGDVRRGQVGIPPAEGEEIPMRRLSVFAAVVAAISLLFVPGALSAGQNPPSSCGLGSAISVATQQLGGIGKEAKAEGVNPGEVFQEFRGLVITPVCTA